MACLQMYRELLSLKTFLQVHSNLKEVFYLSWQNTYPTLKTTCHITLKFFLWTKLLENLLLAKYLISVAAPLTSSNKKKKFCLVLIYFFKINLLILCFEFLHKFRLLFNSIWKKGWLIYFDSCRKSFCFGLRNSFECFLYQSNLSAREDTKVDDP